MTAITIPRPDDWHLHFRDGAVLDAVAPESARDFARGIVMPNLVPPVVRGTEAAAYRDRILAALPDGMSNASSKVAPARSGGSSRFSAASRWRLYSNVWSGSTLSRV